MSLMKKNHLLLQMKKMNLLPFMVMVVLVSSSSSLFPVVSSLRPVDEEEGKALKSIKASFSNVVVLLDWDEIPNHCSWRGVSCDNISFSVVSLDLSNLNLGGEISSAIGDLKNLQNLVLKRNHLIGQIPDEIGRCINLKRLVLKNNYLTGEIPDEIGNCINLKHLLLRNNHLTGRIPDEISKCINMKQLDLSVNSFHGDIPFSIFKLKQLEILALRNNLLTGPIPSTLSRIPNFRTLDLAETSSQVISPDSSTGKSLRGNSLTGILSPDMCQLTGLWDRLEELLRRAKWFAHAAIRRRSAQGIRALMSRSG